MNNGNITISGERKGKQAFASLRFKSEKNYGNINITPMTKINYGVTHFSDFTDL